MESVIRFIIADVPLWGPILAIILGFISYWRGKTPLAEGLLLYLLLFMGIQGLWGFLFHVFFPAFTSQQIGWARSPFEYEIGIANLSYGVLGLMSFFKKDRGMWLASTVAISIFLFGAGLGHVYQLVALGNKAPSNAGIILYMDLIVPIIMMSLLWRWIKANS